MRVTDSGPGIPRGRPGPHLRAVLERTQRRQRARPRHRPRFHRGQRRPRLGRAPQPAARRSPSRFPRRAFRHQRDERTPNPRRRRRAADPARAADQPARGRLRGGVRRRCGRSAGRGRRSSAGRGDPRSRPSGRHRHRGRSRSCANGRTSRFFVLSVVGDDHEKVAALDAGADDYVTKPFSVDELLARLRAALRRVEPVRRPCAGGRRATMDLEKRAVWSRDSRSP